MNALTIWRPARNHIYCMDAFLFLRSLPTNSINCIVTSPPYYGLRDYGTVGQIGLERSVSEFVATMVALFREARRVLRDDGVCWVVLGDSYASFKGQSGGQDGTVADRRYAKGDSINRGYQQLTGRKHTRRLDDSRMLRAEGLQPKSMIGIPWRVALALQADGWILRSDVIWSKPNPMPESVTDRPTKAHEYCFLFAKSGRYWWDAEAVRSPASHSGKVVSLGEKSFSRGQASGANVVPSGNGKASEYVVSASRNLRTVWEVATEPTPFAHFATFPRKLIEPMIKAGCPDKACSKCGAPYERQVTRQAIGKTSPVGYRADEAKAAGISGRHGEVSIETLGFSATCNCNAETQPGLVFDPFMGSGTTGLVARSLGRDYVGCDLNPDYVKLAQSRLELPLLDLVEQVEFVQANE